MSVPLDGETRYRHIVCDHLKTVSQALNGKLVLVVDDEEAIAEALVSFLEAYGYTTIAFKNPREALASASVLKPDLLVSEFQMDTMDGLTLAMRLTELHPDCKVLIMSGAAREAVTHPAFERFEFLQKPVTLSVLLGKVVEVLGSGAGDDVAQDSEPQLPESWREKQQVGFRGLGGLQALNAEHSTQ